MTEQGLLPPPRSPGKSLIVSPLPQKETHPSHYNHIRTWADEADIQVLAVDYDGQIWGAGSGGVVRWVVSPNQISYRVWHVEHGIADGDVLSIIVAPNNHIFVGHASGKVSEFNQYHWAIHETGLDFAVHSLGLSPDGHVLACTDGALFDVSAGEPAFKDAIPAASLCVASAFGRLWLGTENGLYERKSNQWQLHPDFPHCAIRAIDTDGTHLWLTTTIGIVVGHPDKTWENHRFNETVYNIVRIQQYLLAATESGLWLDAGNGFQKWWPKPDDPSQPVHHVIVSGNTVIHTMPDNVQLIDTRIQEPRLLLPEYFSVPRDIRRVFKANTNTLIQALDCTVWMNEGDDPRWENVTERDDAMLTAAIMLDDEWLIGLNGRKGLATIINGRLVSNHSLSFVVDFIQHQGKLFAATVNALYMRADEKHWRRVVAIKEGSVLGLTLVADELVVVTTQGIYAGSTELKRLPDSHIIRTFGADDAAIVYVTKDNTLHMVDASFRSRECDIDVGVIRSVALIGEALAIGTVHGLKLLQRDTHKPLTEIAAPFTSAIMEMKVFGHILWLLTASGSVEIDLTAYSK